MVQVVIIVAAAVIQVIVNKLIILLFCELIHFVSKNSHICSQASKGAGVHVTGCLDACMVPQNVGFCVSFETERQLNTNHRKSKLICSQLLCVQKGFSALKSLSIGVA